jgi:hypothetical protein
MYVAALAQPLSVEYLLLDEAQHAAARDHPDGLFDFVERTQALRDGAPRFRSVAALRRHCSGHGVEIAGTLHGCPGEKGSARVGGGLRPPDGDR